MVSIFPDESGPRLDCEDLMNIYIYIHLYIYSYAHIHLCTVHIMYKYIISNDI